MPPPAVERAWEAIALTMVALRDGDEHAAFSSAGLDASVTALRFRRGEGNEVTLGGHFLGRAIKTIVPFITDGDSVLHVRSPSPPPPSAPPLTKPAKPRNSVGGGAAGLRGRVPHVPRAGIVPSRE